MTKVKWPKVLDFNDLNSKPICRWIDLGNATMFRISAFFTYSFDEMPRDGLFIAIERVGSFLFDLHKFHWEYVAEKLNLSQSDAAAIADWMNAQCDYDTPQQGIYNERYIKEVEPYGLLGEKWLMPLVPEIIITGQNNE